MLLRLILVVIHYKTNDIAKGYLKNIQVAFCLVWRRVVDSI